MLSSRVLLCILVASLGSCSQPPPSQETLVVKQYATIVHANYVDILAHAQTLRTAAEALVANPSESTHAAAKQAWLDTRSIYGESEACRFYGGPIDQSGTEGRINAWPIDENFID